MAASCQTLRARLQALKNQLQHVFDPQARDELIAEIAAVRQELREAHCDELLAVLSGVATIWAQNQLLPNGAVSRTRSFGVGLSFQADPGVTQEAVQTTGAISVETRPNDLFTVNQVGVGRGAFTRPTGGLVLSITLRAVVQFPFMNSDVDFFLSTDSSVTTRDGTFAGSAVNPDGTVMLVAASEFSNRTLAGSPCQIRVIGTIAPSPRR